MVYKLDKLLVIVGAGMQVLKVHLADKVDNQRGILGCLREARFDWLHIAGSVTGYRENHNHKAASRII